MSASKVEIIVETSADPATWVNLEHKMIQAIALIERSGSELCVRLVDDATIQALHLTYMDDDTPTDVLSFEQDCPPAGSAGLLGDIVVSLDTAQKQALQKPWDIQNEVLYLAIHGLLHLIGYDHATADEEKAMFGLQNELFEKVSRS